MPIPTKRATPHATASSYSGPSHVFGREAYDSIDHYGRDECPATPHNATADLIEWSQASQQENAYQTFHPLDCPPDQLDELKQFGIDPNGYGSTMNRIQDMWRPHSL